VAMSSSKSSASPALVLDERQREAIEHVQGPLLVVAGAGTGKTTVLTRRIARLIREGHARSDQILALTYTDNAAAEMRERVRTELGRECAVRAVTFHSYCFTLLERCGKKFGVLDDKDLWVYLRKRIRELNLEYFVRAANLTKFLDDLLEFMRRCQDELVDPEQYAEYVRRVERCELGVPRVTRSKDAGELSDEEIVGRCREIASVFSTVERMLGEDNLGTFGHMITRAYEHLRDDPQLLAAERERTRFILVDEFQDANFAQVKMLELLAGEQRNIFAVGDPDQAIYRFRGASSAAFGLFRKHFAGSKVVSLEKNQRSTTPILKCAYAVISRNPSIFAGAAKQEIAYQHAPLQSAREEAAAREGKLSASDPVEAVSWRDRELESGDLVGRLQQMRKKQRCSWNSFAILYRNHSHRDEVVEELSRRRIPFSIESMDVLDTPEVRDLLACVGVVVSPGDSASLFRVAALAQFGLNPEDLRAAMKAAGREAKLADVLRALQGGAAVLDEIESARDEISRSPTKARAALDILIRRFRLDGQSAAMGAALEFVSGWEKKAITRTGELGELIEYLEYFREARGTINLVSQERDAVRLMTAHATKGLEFDHVFIIRAYSGCFPSGYREPLFEFPRELHDRDSIVPDDDKTLNEQEERRLFYVAMTRARNSLTLYAKHGMGKKDPTPAGFLRELLKDAALQRFLRQREANPLQVDLFASEEMAVASVSQASQWLGMDFDRRGAGSLSATAVEMYETCPLKFKLEREWRIPGEAPAAMQYGASIHRVLRTYYDGVRFERPPSDEELVELFRADLAAAHLEDRYQHELYEQQGVEQLRDFLEASRRGVQREILHTEQNFSVRIGDNKVVGRIDRVDRVAGQHIVIVDYKTGKPRSQEDADESLQLSIYAIAAKEMWGYEADRLVFYNLEDNTAVSTTRSPMQLQEAQAKVSEVAGKIAAGEFDAKPGFQCSFCSYRNLCPATEKPVYVTLPAQKAAASKIQ
jgi:DNA helicase II / ATP-dependent DNA helicase PcrA